MVTTKTMKNLFLRSLILFLFVLSGNGIMAQANALELSPDDEKKFTPYLMYRYGGPDGVAELKANKPHLYLKEMWYLSKSFYVKRDHLNQGVTLDESIIDISRFEKQRQATVETIIVMPGFKDALVLLPLNQLIYKP